MEYADLVSEMVEQVRPYPSGIKTQCGIDFLAFRID
jgi:ATP:corrinoid adenosyltransferase